jgi:hypothetical protein
VTSRASVVRTGHEFEGLGDVSAELIGVRCLDFRHVDFALRRRLAGAEEG